LPSTKALHLSEPADADIDQIAQQTRRQWGEGEKQKNLAQLNGAFRTLIEMPGIGVSRDDISTGLRTFPFGSHLIFYRETRSAVMIVRVLHERMDPARHLRE
jgi:toxin ParE1/3/4